MVSTAVASEQQQRLEWLKKSHEAHSKEMYEEIRRLRSEMFRLKERLSEKERELKSANAGLRHAKADMDGTMKRVYDLRDENARLHEELEPVKKDEDPDITFEKALKEYLNS